MSVATIRFSDPVRVDTTCLNRICDDLGHQAGEAAICAAMEDVAVLIRTASDGWGRGDLQIVQPTARQVSGIATRLGLVTLARTAAGVADLCDKFDGTAMAAAVARMVRLGEQSLIAVWEAQDVSL